MKTAVFLCMFAALAAVGQAYFAETPLRAGLRRRPKIVGGEEAKPHSLPYQLAITENKVFCGASLITKRFALTAAHCGVDMKKPTVIMGAHKVLSQEPEQVIIKAKQMIVHEKFSILFLKNDIALVELSQDAPINDNIKVIKLPPSDAGLFVGQLAKVSGWGRAYENSTSISPVLRFTESTIMTNNDCEKKFGSIKIADTMICLDGSQKKSACHGDSGGPLTANFSDGKVQIGIVSFGSSAGCEKGYPSVYTRVTNYIDWIHSKIYKTS